MIKKSPANLSYSDFLLIDTQASAASSCQLASAKDWSLPVKDDPKPDNTNVPKLQEIETTPTNTTKRAWNTVPQSTTIAATEQAKRKKATERTNSPRKSADSSQSKSSARSDQSGTQKINNEKSNTSGEHREIVHKPRVSVTQQKEPTFYIGGGNGAALVEKILLEMGWKRVTEKYNENYKLKWVEARSMVNYGSFREGEQLVNRIPNCSLLTNKLGLLNSLQRYDRVNATINSKRIIRMKSSDFLPETYRVDDPIDRKLFLETYKDGETWICKPAGMNQGKGIYLVRDIDDFKKILDERDEKIKKSKRPGVERIVQRYIQNPLLLEGRKFDVRAFMLIGSTAPYLILYHKGYVRRCLHDYKADDNNLMIHLTNQYVQKRDAEYKNNLEDTVWSMDKFNDYINTYVAPHRGLPQDWVYTVFSTRMKQIMLFCFNAVKHKLKCRMGYFDLYGLDFMIDEQMKIWLIEINSNPSLATNCKSLKEVIPGVVKETLHIAIECFEKVRRNKPIIPIQSIKGFEIIYCGTNARRKPGFGTRIEAVSPIRSSPTGFFTARPSSLSPLLRSRSLSPARDFTQSVNSGTQAQNTQRHITYQTPNQRLKYSSPYSARSPNSDGSEQSTAASPPQRSASPESPQNSGSTADSSFSKGLAVNGFGQVSADLPPADGSQRSKASSPSSSAQDGGRKMPKLEERLMTSYKIYTKPHGGSTRSHIMPAMVGLWGTLPDLQRTERNLSSADAIKFRMTHVPQNSPATKSGGSTSPHLYLTPRHNSKPGHSNSEQSSSNAKRLPHKISLTGIRVQESEKDLLVDTKSQSPPLLSDELTLLTDIKRKDGSSAETNIGLRQALRMSRKSSSADSKCQMNTAQVADLSSELKLAKELIRLPNTILQQNKKTTIETASGEKPVENQVDSQAKPCRYKQLQSDKTISSTRLKLESYGRQKKAARVGAS